MLISRRKLLMGGAALGAFAALPKHADANYLGVLQQQAQRHAAAPGGDPVTIGVSYVDDGTANPSGSVTVPSGATFAIVFCWSQTTSTDRTLTAVTLGTGVDEISFTNRHSNYYNQSFVDPSEDIWTANVASLAGGSETLAATRSGTVTEGGGLVCVWCSDITSVRDADGDTGAFSTEDASITIDSATTDLIVGCAGSYDVAATLPTNMSWLDSQHTYNGDLIRVFYGDGATTSTTLTVTTDWAFVLGISLT